jgi:hypothetical protein
MTNTFVLTQNGVARILFIPPFVVFCCIMCFGTQAFGALLFGFFATLCAILNEMPEDFVFVKDSVSSDDNPKKTPADSLVEDIAKRVLDQVEASTTPKIKLLERKNATLARNYTDLKRLTADKVADAPLKSVEQNVDDLVSEVTQLLNNYGDAINNIMQQDFSQQIKEPYETMRLVVDNALKKHKTSLIKRAYMVNDVERKNKRLKQENKEAEEATAYYQREAEQLKSKLEDAHDATDRVTHDLVKLNTASVNLVKQCREMQEEVERSLSSVSSTRLQDIKATFEDFVLNFPTWERDIENSLVE